MSSPATLRIQADRARVGQELAIGRRIQLVLLRRRFPDVAGWTFAARYEPAREVGGDLFDAFLLRGRTDQIGLLIARAIIDDVTAFRGDAEPFDDLTLLVAERRPA